jgi:aspartate--ammonia ligase
MALAVYGFSAGEGLYTDMNAIRRDEEMDNLHSVYTDQWDWEKIITRETRNENYLKKVVQGIVGAICDTLDFLKCRYPQIDVELCRTVTFITAQELENLYPSLTPEQREHVFVKEHKTVFIMQIGDKLQSGKPHGNRAPDYDDWSLNGDILFWDDVLDCAMEISSMGIRVDEKSLDEQLTKANANERRELPFHKALLAGELPLTMGGGIGQSRLSMLLLGKAHIGEVQVSLWDEETKRICKENDIVLL